MSHDEKPGKALMTHLGKIKDLGVDCKGGLKKMKTNNVISILHRLCEIWDASGCVPATKTKDKFAAFKKVSRVMEINHIAPTAGEIKKAKSDGKMYKKLVRVLQLMVDRCLERHGNSFYTAKWGKGTQSDTPDFNSDTTRVPAVSAYQLPDDLSSDAVPSFGKKSAFGEPGGGLPGAVPAAPVAAAAPPAPKPETPANDDKDMEVDKVVAKAAPAVTKAAPTNVKKLSTGHKRPNTSITVKAGKRPNKKMKKVGSESGFIEMLETMSVSGDHALSIGPFHSGVLEDKAVWRGVSSVFERRVFGSRILQEYAPDDIDCPVRDGYLELKIAGRAPKPVLSELEGLVSKFWGDIAELVPDGLEAKTKNGIKSSSPKLRQFSLTS